MFGNLKIGVRLGIAFAILVTLLGSVYYIGISRLANLNSIVSEITQSNQPKTQFAYEMLSTARETSLRVRNLILRNDPTATAKEQDALREGRASFDTSEAALEKLFKDSSNSSDAERQFGVKIHEAITALRSEQDKVVVLAMANKDRDATEVLLSEENRAASHRLYQNLQDLVSLEDKANE